MANTKNQKLKILFIYKYLSLTSGEEDALSTKQIIERLAKDNITAERKSVCNDIKTLSEFGIPIRNNKRKGYYILSSGMQRTEYRILTEIIRSMQFISEQNTEILLNKLNNITSYNKAHDNLHCITDTKYIKTPNNSTLETIDRIYYAIDNMLKITNDGRKLALDQRKYHINTATTIILKIWFCVRTDVLIQPLLTVFSFTITDVI